MDKAQEKMGRARIQIPIEIKPVENSHRVKPKIQLKNTSKVEALKDKLRAHKLVTVCEEASCPNLFECFGHGTATFMIMGDKCTRRCSFCDVAHGRPDPLDPEEPRRLAALIADMALKYVVITSVDRDDLKDGGALHFAKCIEAIRAKSPEIKIEILVPDFRGRMEKALAAFDDQHLPEVFNHNIETVPELYRMARPGADYQWSLDLLKNFKEKHPHIRTKSGLMLGLGETDEQVENVLRDLKAHGVDMITIGQYLQPSAHHLPVARYASTDVFEKLKAFGLKLGFEQVASGPLVRSSYHADLQAQGETVS